VTFTKEFYLKNKIFLIFTAVQRGRVSTQPLLPGQYPFVGGNFMNGHSFADGYIGALMRAEAMYSGPRYASAAHCFPAAASNYIGGVENVTEIASRLLFSSVGWCRGIPFFNDLNANDQWCLVKNSWTDLFILSAAQSGAQLISPQVLAAANLQSHYSGTERLQQVYNSCTAFQDRVEKLKALHLDAAEYSCLKAIVLYSAGKILFLQQKFLKIKKLKN
jgi:nuclear receptor subfamily 2 group F member 3